MLRHDRRTLLKGALALAATPWLPRHESRSFARWVWTDPLTGRQEEAIEYLLPGQLMTISDGAGNSITLRIEK